MHRSMLSECNARAAYRNVSVGCMLKTLPACQLDCVLGWGFKEINSEFC